jgi:hypothetical protein
MMKAVNNVQEEALVALASMLQGHNPGPVPTGFRGMCCVCHLEEGFHRYSEKEKRRSELVDILEISPDSISKSKGLNSV